MRAWQTFSTISTHLNKLNPCCHGKDKLLFLPLPCRSHCRQLLVFHTGTCTRQARYPPRRPAFPRSARCRSGTWPRASIPSWWALVGRRRGVSGAFTSAAATGTPQGQHRAFGVEQDSILLLLHPLLLLLHPPLLLLLLLFLHPLLLLLHRHHLLLFLRRPPLTPHGAELPEFPLRGHPQPVLQRRHPRLEALPALCGGEHRLGHSGQGAAQRHAGGDAARAVAPAAPAGTAAAAVRGRPRPLSAASRHFLPPLPSQPRAHRRAGPHAPRLSQAMAAAILPSPSALPFRPAPRPSLRGLVERFGKRLVIGSLAEVGGACAEVKPHPSPGAAWGGLRRWRRSPAPTPVPTPSPFTNSCAARPEVPGGGCSRPPATKRSRRRTRKRNGAAATGPAPWSGPTSPPAPSVRVPSEPPLPRRPATRRWERPRHCTGS